jgi:hypothetical protein
MAGAAAASAGAGRTWRVPLSLLEETKRLMQPALEHHVECMVLWYSTKGGNDIDAIVVPSQFGTKCSVRQVDGQSWDTPGTLVSTVHS